MSEKNDDTKKSKQKKLVENLKKNRYNTVTTSLDNANERKNSIQTKNATPQNRKQISQALIQQLYKLNGINQQLLNNLGIIDSHENISNKEKAEIEVSNSLLKITLESLDNLIEELSVKNLSENTKKLATEIHNLYHVIFNENAQNINSDLNTTNNFATTIENIGKISNQLAKISTNQEDRNTIKIITNSCIAIGNNVTNNLISKKGSCT